MGAVNWMEVDENCQFCGHQVTFCRLLLSKLKTKSFILSLKTTIKKGAHISMLYSVLVHEVTCLISR
jgi:hypothetical protein